MAILIIYYYQAQGKVRKFNGNITLGWAGHYEGNPSKSICVD
jgi:hypothetical protein